MKRPGGVRWNVNVSIKKNIKRHIVLFAYVTAMSRNYDLYECHRCGLMVGMSMVGQADVELWCPICNLEMKFSN